MCLYEIAFDHRPWSTFTDAEKIKSYNPLMRVPVLVLDDGEVIVESNAILDYFDELAGPGKALIERSGPERRHALRICSLATGLADKSVSLIYEHALHASISPIWVERCRAQIQNTLGLLEVYRASVGSKFWFGDTIGHADIAVACALRITREAHDGLFDQNRFQALADHADVCESLPEFRRVVQPLQPPRR